MLTNGIQAFTPKNYNYKFNSSANKGQQTGLETNNNIPTMTAQMPKGVYFGQAINFTGKMINLPGNNMNEQQLRLIITNGKAGSTEDFVNEIIERHFIDKDGNYTGKQARTFIEIRERVKKILEEDNEALHGRLGPLVTSSSKSPIIAFNPGDTLRGTALDYLGTNDFAGAAENIRDRKMQKEFSQIVLNAHDITLPFRASTIAGLVLSSCKNPKTDEYVYDNLDEKIAFIKEAEGASIDDLPLIIEASFDENGVFNTKIAKTLIQLQKFSGFVIDPWENRAFMEEFCMKPDSTMDEERFSFFMKAHKAFVSPPEEMRIYVNAAVNPVTKELDPSCFDALFKLADYFENDYPFETYQETHGCLPDFEEIAKEITSTIEIARDPKTGIFDQNKWEEAFNALPKNENKE